MKPIKIFKVGTHTCMQGISKDYTRSMLADCVSAYSPQAHEAPLVVGHPKTEDPAMGWVDHLELSNDGYLLAYTKQIDPEFAESVNAGKHNKVSASFYLPDSPSNPTPGKLYLRHVGFLGAEPPAVKGLGTVQFAENEQGIVDFISVGYAFELISDILRRQRDALIESIGTEEADKQIPNWVIDALNEVINTSQVADSVTSFSESNPSQTQIPETKTAREIELEQQLATAHAAMAAKENAEKEASFSEFVEGLVAGGHMPPKFKQKAVSLLTAAGKQDQQVVNFAEGEVSFSEAVKSFLAETFDSKIISFGEGIKKQDVDPNVNQSENPLIADAKARSA